MHPADATAAARGAWKTGCTPRASACWRARTRSVITGRRCRRSTSPPHQGNKKRPVEDESPTGLVDDAGVEPAYRVFLPPFLFDGFSISRHPSHRGGPPLPYSSESARQCVIPIQAALTPLSGHVTGHCQRHQASTSAEADCSDCTTSPGNLRENRRSSDST